MRYENTRTGAVIDSPYLLTGDNWIPVDNENQEVTDASIDELRALVLEQQNKIDELEDLIDELQRESADSDEDDEDSEEYEEEEVDLQDMTIAELEKLAKDQNIELKTADKKNKDTRIEAIVKALG